MHFQSMEQKRIILLVDDEFIILHSLKIQLERFLEDNYVLETASSGEEAFELLDEFHSNNNNLFLVVSDYNLEDMKGTQILTHAVNLFPNVNKVILSGQLEEPEIKKFDAQYKFDLKLEKPWNIYKLIDLINSTKTD